MSRIPLAQRLRYVVGKSPRLPPLPYWITVQAYADAVDMMCPNGDIKGRILEKVRSMDVPLDAVMQDVIPQVLETIEANGDGLLVEALLFPFFDMFRHRKEEKPKKKEGKEAQKTDE